MKEEIKVLELDKYELGILINALNEFRNKMIKEGKDTEYVDAIKKDIEWLGYIKSH